jgi:hypothetical protein
VDRELATLFLIFDESGLGAEEREAYEYVNNGSGIPMKTWAETKELLEITGRASINGRLFGNLTGLEMNEGERVRWYLFGLGSEQDFHTAHWHGQRVVEDGRRRTDVIELMPASMKTADFVADNPGSWMFHCHVAEHMREGMYARMIVHPRNPTGPLDRATAPAFLGLSGAVNSLTFQRAVALLSPNPSAATNCSIHLRGTVTVFDAFTVFNQSVRLQMGGKSLVFNPDAKGFASTDDGTLQIKNAGSYGVVYGGSMEFEAVLRGPAWLTELKKLGIPSTATPTALQESAVTVKMEIGSAQHTATAQMASRGL